MLENVSEFAKTRFEQVQEAVQKVESEIQRLLDEGRERLEPGRERFDALLERVRESREDFEEQVSDRITQLINAIGLPTANQVDELNARVDQLARKVSKLIGGKNGSKSSARKRKGAAPKAAASA